METAKVEAALARRERTGESIEEAAKAEGVAPSTVHAHKAAKRAKSSSSAPTSSTPPAGSQATALPQGGTPPPPDLLVLVRRILGTRNGAALAELEEGLVVAARGEHDLAAWLARPVTVREIGVDELEALSRGVDVATTVLENAEPGAATLAALRGLSATSTALAKVKATRPPEEKPDEVTRRLCAVRDRAVDRMGLLLGEAVAGVGG